MSIMFGAFLMIFLAEMGDKTQLLAFNLATRYRPSVVLLGVFFGTLVNNGTAIFIGTMLGERINMEIITLVSALAFLGFGTWTLFERSENDPEKQITAKSGLRAFFSVFSLFVILEMGDKTQIASAVYAARYDAPFLTLGGVLAGMLLADALGIYLGHRLQNAVSTFVLKIISSGMFFILGTLNFLSSEIIPARYNLLLVLFFALVLKFFFARLKREKQEANL